MPGHGFGAVLVLRQARTLIGDPRFCGSAASALRQAGKERDHDITHAVMLLKRVRPAERIVKSILETAPHEREAFRRRMLADFDAAIRILYDAVQPSLRRERAVAAARDLQNWEKNEDRYWDLFSRAVDEHDKDGRGRQIDGAETFIRAPRVGANGKLLQ